MYLIFNSEATFETFTDPEEGQHYTEEHTCVGRAKVDDSPLELDSEITIIPRILHTGEVVISHDFSDMEIAEIETRWEWYFSRGYMEFSDRLPGDWEMEEDEFI